MSFVMKKNILHSEPGSGGWSQIPFACSCLGRHKSRKGPLGLVSRQQRLLWQHHYRTIGAEIILENWN